MKEGNQKKKSGSSRIFIVVVAVAAIVAAAVIRYYIQLPEKTVALHRIELVSGNGSCVMPGSEFEVAVKALDEDGAPLKGVRIVPKLSGSRNGSVVPETVCSDAGGMARFKVTSGTVTGDNYLTLTPDNKPDKAVECRFVNGVQLLGADQEGAAGSKLARPVGIRLVDEHNKPRAGVPVYITSDNGCAVESDKVITNADGVAEVPVELTGKSGVSMVNFEISAQPGSTAKYRNVGVRVLGFNTWNIVVNVLGGLALFMLGMTMMSDGLANIAGEKMKSVLAYCTRNRFVALLAGAGITAVIQSSSATTVMIIGFVNAGLMSLAQSIGVIFGANIGTTITAQIIAFNIGVLAMPAIIIGLVLRFIKRGKIAEIGGTVLGFGLLFFGMELMSGELKALSVFPSFLKFFQMFDCAPVDGLMPLGNVMASLLVGVLATLVVQSSSATTGVVVVLGAGGLINLYTAVALILGANVGTTITAQLAAIPANRLARQAALAHTLFNVFGVVIVLLSFLIPWGSTGIPAFFYAVNSMTEGNAFAVPPENMARHIANAHTLFNVATALLLLPISNLMARICEKLLPLREQKIHFQYLEPHLLDSPALALRQSTVALGKMLKKSWKMVDSAVRDNFIPGHVDEARMKKFNSREERVDRYQTEIMEYLSQIMRRKITPHQAEIIPGLMHCANDAERIADRAENMITLTRRMEADNLKLSRPAIGELENIFAELSKQTVFALNALEHPDMEWKERAANSEVVVNRLAAESEEAHIKRMKSSKCTAQTGIIYAELLAELVAVSRHLSNIAERAV